MFGSNRIKLDKDLLAKVKKYSEVAGYSSVEEFITHALEKELAQLEDADSEEELKKRRQGLGYSSEERRCRSWCGFSGESGCSRSSS